MIVKVLEGKCPNCGPKYHMWSSKTGTVWTFPCVIEGWKMHHEIICAGCEARVLFVTEPYNEA